MVQIKNLKKHRLLKKSVAFGSLVPLSHIQKLKLYSEDNTPLGTVSDVVIRWDGTEQYPLVTGFTFIDNDQSERFVPFRFLTDYPKNIFGTRFITNAKHLDNFKRMPGEIKITQDVKGRQLVDVDGKRVLRAKEFYIAPILNRLRLVGTSDHSGKIPRFKKVPFLPSKIVDWAAVQPFGEPNSLLHLSVPHKELKRLHPSELADLMEDLDGEAQDELASSLDPEEAADLVEEMEPEHVEDLLHKMGAKKAATIIERMEPDEAADALRDLDRAEADEILSQLPLNKARELTRLLGYPENMAGGFMTTTLVTCGLHDSVASIKERLKEFAQHQEDIDSVAVVDDSNKLIGELSIFKIAISDDEQEAADLLDDKSPIVVSQEALIDEVTDELVKSRQKSIIVVDEDMHPVGKVLADDVIDNLREGGIRSRLPWLFYKEK